MNFHGAAKSKIRFGADTRPIIIHGKKRKTVITKGEMRKAEETANKRLQKTALRIAAIWRELPFVLSEYDRLKYSFRKAASHAKKEALAMIDELFELEATSEDDSRIKAAFQTLDHDVTRP